MGWELEARRVLDAQLQRLRDEHLVVVTVGAARDLLSEPDSDTMAMAVGTPRAGIDELGSLLLAARRLPSELTVRVVLTSEAGGTPSLDAIESVFRGAASDRSAVAWRDAMAQRSMGLRQLPIGLVIAALSWMAAYAFGYLATQVEGAAIGVLAVSAMIAITIAWVVSWMVVEETMLDWRLDARSAACWELLSKARLEFTTERS
jgi:hypothetical protein